MLSMLLLFAEEAPKKVDDPGMAAIFSNPIFFLGAVGSPAPMSRNWRMPCTPARSLTVRARNARFDRAELRIAG